MEMCWAWFDQVLRAQQQHSSTLWQLLRLQLSSQWQAHRCTMYSGTSHLDTDFGFTLMCSLLVVSGVTSAVSCLKPRPIFGSWSSCRTAVAV
jgi:hypothetical protein